MGETVRIAEREAAVMRVGKHNVAHLELENGVSVLLRLNNDGSGPSTGLDVDCLTCRISKISSCSLVVCPEIKAKDPNASCSDAIRRCVALACEPVCGGGPATVDAGFSDMMILA